MTDHVQDHMLAYVDGTLSDDTRAIVDAHLADCAGCRRELSLIAAADRELRALVWPAAPAGLGLRAAARARAGKTMAVWLGEAPGRARWIAGSVALAATIAVMVLARWTRPANEPSTGQFVVALFAPPAGALPADPAGLAAWARDYRDWGAAMRRDPRFVTSLQLRGDGGRLLRDGVAQAADTSALWNVQRTLQGFLIVRARDYAEAVAIAQRSPHLRYGGTIVVREAR